MSNQQNGNGRLLDPTEVGEILGLSARSLERWRSEGRGPVYVRLSARRIRYRRADVDRWINRQVRASTSATRPPAEVAS